MQHRIREWWAAGALGLALAFVPACEQEEPQDLGVYDDDVDAVQYDAGVGEPELDAPPAAPLADEEAALAEDETPPAGEGEVLAMPIAAGENGALQLERTGDGEVRVGQEYTYSVRVTNTSDQPLHDVTVTEFVPANFEIYESTPQMQPAEHQMPDMAMGQNPQPGQAMNRQPAGPQQQQQRQPQQRAPQQGEQGQQGQQPGMAQGYGPAASWSLGLLMPEQTRTIRVTGVAHSEGEAQSCLVVDYKPAVCTTINFVQPEITLQRMVIDADGEPVEQAYACEELFLAYRLVNTGSATTSPAMITEELPRGVRVDGRRQVELEAGALEPGEEFEERIPLEIDDAVSFRGFAVATTGELRVRSNRQQVQIMDPALELQVSGPEQAQLGDPIRYRVTVTNPSPFPAIETAVALDRSGETAELVVDDAELDEAEQAVVIGRLGPGESQTFTVAMEPDSPGMVGIEAIATAYCARSQAQVVQTDVMGIPALVVEVVDNNDPVEVGGTTIYEISVKNQGTGEDLNIQLEGQLPPGMEYVRGRGDTRVNAEGDQIQFAPVENLPPGEVVSWLVEGRAVDAAGPGRFRLELSSDFMREPIIEQEPTTLY